jgi:hypothetical protein
MEMSLLSNVEIPIFLESEKEWKDLDPCVRNLIRANDAE